MAKSMRRVCASSSMITRIVLVLLCLTAFGTAAAQEVRYIHTDALGSVAVVTDASRNVIERREYEPYGLQLTPAVSGRPGYTGHVQDAATGLTYMQQRYYDPAIGRFLSVDPVTVDANTAANFNRYWYANNNPYKFTDPDGRQSTSVERAIDRDVAAVARGEMSQSQFNDHAVARGLGAAVAAGVVATAVAAPAAGMAVLANPGAIATATEVAAGAAGVTGVAGAGAVAGKMTGYTKHGLNQAISRDGGRGVSPKAILSAVKDPVKVAEQAGGKTAYTGQNAKVVLNSEGKVITTIPRNREALRDPGVK